MSKGICFPLQLTLNGTIFELPKTQRYMREHRLESQQPAHSNSVISEFLPSQAITLLLEENLPSLKKTKKKSQLLRRETTLIFVPHVILHWVGFIKKKNDKDNYCENTVIGNWRFLRDDKPLWCVKNSFLHQKTHLAIKATEISHWRRSEQYGALFL